MSMLGAFLRGAAGPGLIDLSNRMDRRDAEERDALRIKSEREEERAWREREAEKDRAFRAEAAGIRGGTRSKGDAGGDDEAGIDTYAVAELMKREGISEGEARAMIRAGQQGANPLVKSVNDESGGHSAPDMERWAQVNRTIAQAMIEGRSKARSNYAQLTEGDSNAQRNTITSGMLAGKLTPAQTAEGVAASKGEGAFKNARTNEFTGTPTAIGKSEIAENNAQAGSAGRANRDALDGLKLPAAVKATLANFDAREKEIASAITKAQAEDTWNPAASPGQKALQAELAAVRLKRQQLVAPYLPKAEGGNADPLGLMGGNAPAPAAKPSQSDVRKSEPKAGPVNAPERERTMVEIMSDRDLRKIAAIEGHRYQKEAKAELERRRAAAGNRDEVPPSAAGMLNMGA